MSRNRIVRALRVVALLAFGYTLFLLAFGGFETNLLGLTIRSRNVDRFVTVGALAWVLAWWLGPPSPPPSPALSSGGLWRARRRLGASRIVLLASMFVIALVAAVWAALQLTRGLPEETPFGDFAILELYTRDATAGDLEVGPYSRFRWNHPGPAMFYMFGPLYQWSGEKLSSLRASALVFNLVVLALTFSVLARRGPPWFASIVIAALALYLVRVPDLLGSPWNPHLTVLPMGLLIVSCAAIAAGAATLWPLVAVVASFVIQCHLSVAPAILVMLLATGVLIARHTPVAERKPHWKWIAIGAVPALALWIRPLLHELSSPSSNVGAILQSFLVAPHSTAPMRDGLAATLDMLSAFVRPGLDLAWGGTVIRSVGVVALIVSVGSLLLARWTASRLAPAGRFAVKLAWLGAWTSVAALWASSRIQGQVMDQLVFWITIVGVLNLACLTAAVLRSFLAPAPGPAVPNRPAPALLAVVLVAFAIAVPMGALEVRRSSVAYANDTFHAPRVRDESAALAATLEREGLRRPLVYVTQDTWSDAAGILLALRKRGFTPSVESDWIFMFAPPSAPTGLEDSEVVIAGLDDHRRLRQPGFRVVGEWSGVSIHVRRLF